MHGREKECVRVLYIAGRKRGREGGGGDNATRDKLP